MLLIDKRSSDVRNFEIVVISGLAAVNKFLTAKSCQTTNFDQIGAEIMIYLFPKIRLLCSQIKISSHVYYYRVCKKSALFLLIREMAALY
jgi:hypothetical protein